MREGCRQAEAKSQPTVRVQTISVSAQLGASGSELVGQRARDPTVAIPAQSGQKRAALVRQDSRTLLLP